MRRRKDLSNKNPHSPTCKRLLPSAATNNQNNRDMHQPMLLALVATLALTAATTSIPLPHALALLRPSNVTSLDRENWPRAPWVQPMDESASIAIEYYGRYVCGDGDAPCEARVIDGLERIVQVVDDEYAMGRGKVDSFRGGPVVLWFRQEKAVPKIVVEDLAVVLGKLMTRYGARELMNAAVVNYGTLAATFELTVPGIERG